MTWFNQSEKGSGESSAQEDNSSSWGRFGCRFEQFFLAEQNDFGVSE